MFEKKAKVEIFKKKDKASWEEVKKVLADDGSVKFKSGHYFNELLAGGGCGAKLDPRNFGSKGKLDREIYWVRVDEADLEKAMDVLLKAGITPVVDEQVSVDAHTRIYGDLV